jgi:phosphotriesterase-related protein
MERTAIGEPSVETMTGPVAVDRLGFTLMHEHIIGRSEGVTYNFPRVFDAANWLKEAYKALVAAKASGIDTIVDLTVMGIGRDVPLLAPIAEKAGINVIAATGLYTFDEVPGYFRPRHTDEVADLFVADITEGIQATDVKAAMIKCCTDEPGVTPGVEKVLRASARAHLRTGAPISTHTHAGLRRGLDQQRIFAEEGVDLRRVVIGHSGDSEDLDYLTKLMDAGSYIGMDRFGLDMILPDDKRVATIAKLCEMGYAERMVLSHDASVYMDSFPPAAMKQFAPNWHYLHVPNDVIPALREAGVTQSQIDLMMRENPRRIFENAGAC